MTTYDTVKDLWRQKCVGQPLPANYIEGTEPGADDSSIFIHRLQQRPEDPTVPSEYHMVADRAEYTNTVTPA